MRAGWFTEATSGSETGDLALRTDWAVTPLGEPWTWPQTLRTAVTLCFGTRFPVLITWGSDLRMIYNDGYRELLGRDKHPHAMGAPAEEVWGEVWPEIAPLFAEVLRTGTPTWAVDHPLLLERSGFLEETAFTFSYSPIHDDDGVPRGVLDIVHETTESVVDRRRLATVTSLSAALQGLPGDVEELAHTAVTHLAASTDVRAASLHLWRDGELLLLGATGDEPATEALDALRGTVVTTLRPVAVGHTLVAPLMAARDTRCAGVAVLEGNPRRPFDAPHRAFLEVLAATVGTALSSTIQHVSEMAELRRVSDALQTAMLPDTPENLDVVVRYRPATGSLSVGGDWYDVVELSPTRRALLVGDCVGHGLEAAALMGQLRSAGRSLLLQDMTPGQTLEGLDRFAATLPGAECTTVFCCIVDDVAATVHYSSAGHLPQLVHRTGGPLWLDAATGLPLAVGGGRRPEAVRALQDDDTLLLFTDGLVERRDESLHAGLERLARTLDAVDGEVDPLLATMLEPGQRDDVALVRYRHRPTSTTTEAVGAAGGAPR